MVNKNQPDFYHSAQIGRTLQEDPPARRSTYQPRFATHPDDVGAGVTTDQAEIMAERPQWASVITAWAWTGFTHEEEENQL